MHTLSVNDIYMCLVQERMRSRGRFRGRGGGKSRGASRGYGRGSRHRDYSDVVNSQNRTSRTVRGRGPRRYEALPKNNRDIPASRQKQLVMALSLLYSSSKCPYCGFIGSVMVYFYLHFFCLDHLQNLKSQQRVLVQGNNPLKLQMWSWTLLFLKSILLLQA